MIKSVGAAALTMVAATVLMSACASAPKPRAVDGAGGNMSGAQRMCAVIGPAPRSGQPAPPPPTACPTSAPVFTPPPPAPSTPSIPPSSTKPPGHYPYAWADADDDPIGISATFTLVRGTSPGQALRTLVPNRSTPLESPEQVQNWVASHLPSGSDLSHFPQSVEAGQRHGWTMVLEDNGFRAIDHPTLRRLSRTGAAVVIYNNPDGGSEFLYAVRGRIVRDFDPFADLNNLPGTGPLPQERGIGFGRYQSMRFVSQSIHLAARLVGFTLVPGDLEPSRFDVAVGTTDN